MLKLLFKYLAVLTTIFLSKLAFAIDEDELDITDIYGGEEYVSIATGSKTPLHLAPAVATVITSDDIDKLGATDLNQVLETVPGLHVSASTTGFNPIFTIRGIHTDANAQVLVLINGIPITNVASGNRGSIWGGMPVRNISRIEVMRGPGSAIYGANSFAGVINVITKEASEIDGLRTGFRAGNFDTYQGWLQYGDRFDDLELAFSLQAGTTEGQRRLINEDAQTTLDRFPTSSTQVSLAPGPVSVGRRYIDANLDLALENWRLRLWWQGRDHVGTAAGFSQALDPSRGNSSSRINVDLTYQNVDWFEDWELTGQLSFFDVTNRSNLVLFPAGATFPKFDSQGQNIVGSDTFPNGVLASPDLFERHYRADFSGAYTGFRDHALRMGFGYRFQDMYKVNDEKNFFQNGNPFPIPVTATMPSRPFIGPHSRGVAYGFLQDEWNFWSDWTLTAGLRYDYYTDFGSTINPRVALVWQTTYALTTKLLYGKAFRAPSFIEQFSNQETPSFQGNPGLNPETINTLELAFDYQPRSNFSGKLNLFHYWYNGIIRPVEDLPSSSNPAAFRTRTFKNSGNQRGYGLELEGNWDPLDTVHFTANYAFQRSIDSESHSSAGFAPTHQIYGRMDWGFYRNWNLNLQSNWVGDRKRPANDNRAQVPDYFTVDMAIRGENIFKDLGLTMSVWNMFHANVREPSQPFNNSSLIPGDFPTLGRSFYLEVRYNLR